MKVAVFGRKIETNSIKNFGVLLNLFKQQEGVEWCFYEPFYNDLKSKVFFPNGSLFDSYQNLPHDIDLFFSLGGDGTFLQALTIVRDKRIPIAGINFGRLGFLTTKSVGKTNSWVKKLFSGDYTLEKRALLRLETLEYPLIDLYPFALNEITIQRVQPAMLEISVKVDGDKLPTYWADGILVATATGSTAYSLSIGGPIVTPDSKVLIIAPLAPHNLNIRPLIVPESSKIELSFSGRCDDALLTLDNRYIKIKKGTKIIIEKASFYLNCVTISDNFISALNEKLLWGEDKRNKNNL